MMLVNQRTTAAPFADGTPRMRAGQRTSPTSGTRRQIIELMGEDEMSIGSRAVSAVPLAKTKRHGPLPALLLVLTVVNRAGRLRELS